MQLVFSTDDKNYLTERSKNEMLARVNVVLKSYGYASPKVFPADMYNNTKYVWNINRVNLEEEEQ